MSAIGMIRKRAKKRKQAQAGQMSVAEFAITNPLMALANYGAGFGAGVVHRGAKAVG